MHKKREDVTKPILKQLIRIEGMSQREVSKLFGCSEAFISKKLKEFGLSKKIEDRYIGKKFGILIPTSVSGYDDYSHVIFNCFCECGNEIEVLGNSLITGNTKSCGCESRKRGKDHANFKGYEEITNSYWWSVRDGAKRRKIEFNVTLEEVWDLFLKQGRKCALTGRNIFFAPTRVNTSKQTASLDRIDSSGSYEINNVQWLHFQVNQMKWTLTQEDFKRVCKEVVDYNDE